VNYRNAAEILDIAANVVAHDGYDDLEGVTEAGVRDVQVARRGGATVRIDADDDASMEAALVSGMRRVIGDGSRIGDLAVLASSRADVRRIARVLQTHGIPWVNLEDYDGTTVDRAKIGTFKRAKGLEFTQVFLPWLPANASAQRNGESEAAYRERIELERRELYVGMTRARDGLWLGYLVN
jgi:superfamily I DNA/RNA helicase